MAAAVAVIGAVVAVIAVAVAAIAVAAAAAEDPGDTRGPSAHPGAAMTQSMLDTDRTHEVYRLENGLTVALEPLPHLRSATAGMWIGTGSANESAEQAGISHLLEHLFFKGTESRTARALMDAIECKGGHMNAFTAREHTCLYTKTLDTHIAGAIEILADVVKHSLFCDLEKERNVVLEEVASTLDVPEEHVHDVFAERLWPDHGLGRPIAGRHDTVAGLTRSDIEAYYRAWYRPGNMVFSIAGRFDSDRVLDQVRR